MIQCTIDGQPVRVPQGTTIYQAAKSLGIDLPIFCYHEKMPPFGACRMCLVEVENAPKLQTACTAQVSEGMVVHTQSKKSLQGREEILELLLINHPLDCPICDKGGECPLQDNAMAHGRGISQFHEEKRHFPKPIALTETLLLDRERCILCSRCTRFTELISGDCSLELVSRGALAEVSAHPERAAQARFMANTIAICPVGALTSSMYRFRARPWDNTTTPSTCTHCPVGCATSLDARDQALVRVRSRDEPSVNDVWICDRGAFSDQFLLAQNRLKTPLMRRFGQLEPVSWEEAITRLGTEIQRARAKKKAGGIGGIHLTVEENFLFQKVMRSCLLSPHLDHRIGKEVVPLESEGAPPGMSSDVGSLATASTVLVLGSDLAEEYPVLWLRIQEARLRGAELHFFGLFPPSIKHPYTTTHFSRSGEELALLKRCTDSIETLLTNSPQPVMLIGKQFLASNHRLAVLALCATWKKKFPELALHTLEGRGNCIGARWAGVHPELAPREQAAAEKGLSSEAMIAEICRSGWDFLYLVQEDLATALPAHRWQELRRSLNFLVVQDLLLTASAQDADLVLPTVSGVEKRGTWANFSGRLTQLAPVQPPPPHCKGAAEIFELLGKALHTPLSVDLAFQSTLEQMHLPQQAWWESL